MCEAILLYWKFAGLKVLCLSFKYVYDKNILIGIFFEGSYILLVTCILVWVFGCLGTVSMSPHIIIIIIIAVTTIYRMPTL